MTHRIHQSLLAVLGLCLVAAAGCYTTVPLGSEPPRADREVVLEFTDDGGQRLGGLLGRAVVSARGRPLEWTADTVALAMVATTNAQGGEQFWQGERVAIPRQFVARARERALDRRRTAIAVVGGLAAAVLVQQVTGRNAGAPPIRDPTGPIDNRAP